jgi:hypothetical protein
LGVVYNADYLEDSLAVGLRTFVTVPGRAGELAGQADAPLPVTLDSRGLNPGTHRATFRITGEAGNPLPSREVPVELIVTPAPEAARR